MVGRQNNQTTYGSFGLNNGAQMKTRNSQGLGLPYTGGSNYVQSTSITSS